MISTLVQLADNSIPLSSDRLKQPIECNGIGLMRDSNGNINRRDKNIDKVDTIENNGEIHQKVEKIGNHMDKNNTCDTSQSEDNIITNVKDKTIPQYGKYKLLIWEFQTPLIWLNIFFITLWHVLSVYYALTYPLREKLPLAVYSTIVGGISGFGITAGAHRYFTHRAFRAKTPLKIILLICYSIAGQNTLFDWVRDHRVHHKFSETDADPHNAKRGFFFSHVGWLMMKKHPEVIRKGRSVDMSDITDDPLLALHIRYWIVIKALFCFILPSIIPPLCWGESWFYSITINCFVRYILSLNSTWAVNSFAHFYGNKPYDKKIYPVENLAVSFFAMGEGYHNYHHTFPWDYRASEMGQMLNITTFWLNFYHRIGWAYDMKAPTSDLIQKIVSNHGDGTHYRWGHEVPESCNGSAKTHEN